MKAETDPLDCAYYLLTQDSLEDTVGSSLTGFLFAVGRHDDALRVFKLDPDLHFRIEELAIWGIERVKAGDDHTARKISDAAFDDVEDHLDNFSASDLSRLMNLLLATSQPEKALKIVASKDEEEAFSILVVLAQAYWDVGDRSSAIGTLDNAMARATSDLYAEDLYRLIHVADLYLKLEARSKAIRALEMLEERLSLLEGDNQYFDLFRRYYLLGLKTKAWAVWNKIADREDVHTRLKLSAVLIESKEATDAESILAKIRQPELQTSFVGREVVNQHLQLAKAELAETMADKISSDPDSYDQQAAYMQLADHYIQSKNYSRAKKVLDKAFRNASKIQFEHAPEQSTGASPGTRKWIYLRDISRRFSQFGDLEKAIEVIRAINDEHPIAKERLAVGLANFASDHADQLPRSRAINLLERSISIARAEDAESEIIEVSGFYAEAYAKLGDKRMASEKLAELLEDRKGEYLEGFALLIAGEVFNKYKLPLTERLRSALSQILAGHGL